MVEGAVFEHFAIAGYAVIAAVLSSDEVNCLEREVEALALEAVGSRKLLDAPWCQELAYRLIGEPRFRAVVPAGVRAVRCSLFEKALDKNWLVGLHQDLSIPVAERTDSVRCTGWSEKDGTLFVQPPASVLEDLLIVRLHMDECHERNGALRVVPGSHRLGRLNAAQARAARALRGEQVVPVTRGRVMLMRPLLLHASSKSTVDVPRRVLHFMLGPRTMPEGLKWPSDSRVAV